MPESIRSSLPTPQPATGPDGITILLEGNGILVATVGSYVVLINGGDLEHSGLKALRSAFESRSREAPIGYLVVLEPEITLMLPGDVRAQLAEILASFAERIGGVAVLYEGTGFKATGIRSIATAIHLASRTTFPHKTFANLIEAVVFLSSGLPPSALPQPSELQTHVEGLRERARRRG